MKFANPLYFLFLVPAVALFFLYIFNKIGREPALRYSSVGLIKKAAKRKTNSARFFRGVLRLSVFVFLIFALARPQTYTGEEKTTEHVVDIVMALDVSGSMATLDFHPDNRLEAAKLEARRFIEGRPHDRMGLVVFAGQSITQSPLTVDRKALLTLLARTRLGMLPDGTAIGLGLGSAVNRLKDSKARSKLIILLTDGINNTGKIAPLTAADLAKEFGIRVYTIGVGTEGEALLPIQDPRFGNRLVKVETKIDEKTLTEISRQTGGAYFRARDEKALRDIFQEIDRLEKTEIEVEQFVHFEERFFWFLWPAFYLLLFEVLLANTVFVKLP